MRALRSQGWSLDEIAREAGLTLAHVSHILGPKLPSWHRRRDERRLWSQIKRDHRTKCWLWQGYTRHGYGVVTWEHAQRQAAHIVWELLGHGGVPPGSALVHTCYNRKCCNPAHLQLVDALIAATVWDKQQKEAEKKQGQKLTPADVLTIKEMLAAGVARADIADAYDISVATLSDIATGKRWKGVTKRGRPKRTDR